MAKRGPKPRNVGPKVGPAWKPVKTSALSAKCKQLDDKYKQAVLEANRDADELREALTSEWNEKYPDGIDGKVVAFRVANGEPSYVWKKMPKQKQKKVAKADQERGDDVFNLEPNGRSAEHSANQTLGQDRPEEIPTKRSSDAPDKPLAPQRSPGKLQFHSRLPLDRKLPKR